MWESIAKDLLRKVLSEAVKKCRNNTRVADTIWPQLLAKWEDEQYQTLWCVQLWIVVRIYFVDQYHFFNLLCCFEIFFRNNMPTYENLKIHGCTLFQYAFVIRHMKLLTICFFMAYFAKSLGVGLELFKVVK